MADLEPTPCPSCSAPVLVALLPSGARWTLNAEPEPDGSPVVGMRQTFLSHFADCPNSAQHRKSREAKRG